MSVIGIANIASVIALSEGYRPPFWAHSPTQTYSITCTLPGLTANTVNVEIDQLDESGNVIAKDTASGGQDATTAVTTYFFDATLRAEHVQEAIGTKHPVQVGPAVIDHVYLAPARVTLDVVMSDSVQSFKAGQYSSNSSRSISAYLTFKQIQAARVPIALSTRLDYYPNMYLVDVRAEENAATSRSFRGSLRFEQVITARITAVTVSARPNATGVTPEGTKGVQAVPTELINQIPLGH